MSLISLIIRPVNHCFVKAHDAPDMSCFVTTNSLQAKDISVIPRDIYIGLKKPENIHI